MEPITQPQTLQYLTNAQGDRLGVVLSWETYTQLFQSLTMQADPEYLIGLSESELQALAHCKLAPPEQQHLDDLLDRQTQNALSFISRHEMTHKPDRFFPNFCWFTVPKIPI